MDTELAARLDRSIGPAPDDQVPVAALLEPGRRALRRRRVAAAVGSAAAVLVIAGGVALTTGGGPGRAHEPIAGTPSPSPAAPEPDQAGTAWPGGDDLAVYDGASGEVLIDPAATVVQRVENPYDLTPPAGSVGLSLSRDGATVWYAMAWDDGTSTATSAPADQAEGSFRAWLREVSGIVPQANGDDPSGSDDPPPGLAGRELVRFTPGGEALVPADGVTLLEQRVGVDGGASFAAAADTAAASVRDADGSLYYVLARRGGGGPPQYITVPKRDGGADLDAFLDFARAQYASGEGLL
jgi:hypothetical protein